MTDVTVTVRVNGPYKVVGPVRIVGADGRDLEPPEGKAIALCRCGHSRTKPFCDSSHRRVGFVACTADSARRLDEGRLVSD